MQKEGRHLSGGRLFCVGGLLSKRLDRRLAALCATRSREISLPPNLRVATRRLHRRGGRGPTKSRFVDPLKDEESGSVCHVEGETRRSERSVIRARQDADQNGTL